MPTDHRATLATIKRFDQLIAYLRNEMGWPIDSDDFEELTFDFTPEELGIDAKNSAKIQEIKRLRPLSSSQPWGIFFVKFEPKKLPVVALRRILSQVAIKKRASANSADRSAWAADDLLFVSNYGEGSERQISFAHFAKSTDGHDLPTLKVLGWDNRDTALHLDAVARELTQHLAWPDDDGDVEAWRKSWRSAFTLRHGEVITTSKELSVRLARLAGDIRDRIKSAIAIENDRGPLTKLMRAFQISLVHDLDGNGFADMYAQTIAYGLLSARIANPRKKTVDDFAGHMRTNPFLRELMETFLKVGGRRGKAGGPGIDFDELGVSEVVQLLDDANMEAVVLDFGDKNPQEDPVIHFYELFLKEYDAKKRMQRGVFYTPRPVVSYIVRAVDDRLRSEFGLEDGLADTTTWGEMSKRHRDLKIPEGTSSDQAFVQILDPATGTGTFLVEVIDIVHRTMVDRWRELGHGERKIMMLWNEYVPKNLLSRLHGYELLMAPYAIAHLKVGLKLYETGYRFGSEERARIYLTNALEPAEDFSGTFEFAIPALAHEAQAVSQIKASRQFTVVIGNPPYSGFSSNMNPWIDGLLHGRNADGSSIASYYEVDGAPLEERKVWLQDDYIKFMRLSQFLIDRSGQGIHGFITNSSFLDGPTHRGLRFQLSRSFSFVSVLNLHGSLKRHQDATDAENDENVFDIQQGVAVGIYSRGLQHVDGIRVESRDLRGQRFAKYDRLLSGDLGSATLLVPSAPWFLFIPTTVSDSSELQDQLSLREIFRVKSTCVQTSRDDFVIDFSRAELADRIALLGSDAPDELFRSSYGLNDGRNWKLSLARRDIAHSANWRNSIQRYLYRAFDIREIAYRDSLVNWPRHEVMDNLGRGNVALLVPRQLAGQEFRHVFCTRVICDMCVVSTATKEAVQAHPLFLASAGGLQGTLSVEAETNFTERFTRVVYDRLAIRCQDPTEAQACFSYIYAILHSPGYRSRYAELLKIDFPRVPVTAKLTLFRSLSRLGNDLIGLHLLESPKLESLGTTYFGPKSPEVGRIGWSENTVWLDAVSTKSGHPSSFGTIGFRGVTEDVWNFHIGGYQVCEKWLKDRKGRTLSEDDIAHYQKIVVALSETIRLMQEIDVVIEKHGGWPGAFQSGDLRTAAPKVIPFRPRIVQPGAKERYVTCVPLIPLKVAAGAFSDPQHVVDEGFEWTTVETKRRLRPGMFVAQVVGKSMEPAILDGAYCLFAAPVEGARQGKTVLVQLRDGTDPETGHRYTVKRYESAKAAKGDSWRHERIALWPVNPEFEPIVLIDADEGALQVIAELVEVLALEAFTSNE